ncbi:MAG: hypothetical protein ACO3NZ_10265 [Pirellulales bacterium]
MLYSRVHNLVFAHYPNTGGSSVGTWFRQAFAGDLIDHEPEHPHHHVRKGLSRLRCGPSPPRLPIARWLYQYSQRSTSPHRVPLDVRVLGILREPFDLLRSLFLYWQRPASPDAKSPFIRSAVTKEFDTFVWLATAKRCLPNYHRFYAVGSPTWPQTTLVDFGNLEAGLQEAMNRLAIPVTVQLPRVNVNPARLQATASPGDTPTFDTRMEATVRRHFAWYYSEGRNLCRNGVRSAA